MINFRNIFLLLAALLLTGIEVYASETPQFDAPQFYAPQFDVPSINSTDEPIATLPPEQDKEENEENEETEETAEPGLQVPPITAEPKFEYVKGGKIYLDFAGVPDFQYYIKLSDDNVVSYPSRETTFYYYGHSETIYTYRSKIIDYIYSDVKIVVQALDKYMNMLTQLGFAKLDGLKSETFSDYMNSIWRELIIDPDFVIEPEGIYMSEGEDTFMLILIGASLTTNINNELSDCLELRFYSLSKSGFDTLGIDSALGLLDDSLIINNSQKPTYYTPDVFSDVNELPSPYATYLFTPDAKADVNDLPKKDTAPSLYTPDVLDDVNEMPKNQQPPLSTPDAIGDVNELEKNQPPSPLSTPDAIGDVNELEKNQQPSLSTPDAVVNELEKNQQPPPLSTPDAIEDVEDIPLKGSSNFITPNVFDDIREVK